MKTLDGCTPEEIELARQECEKVRKEDPKRITGAFLKRRLGIPLKRAEQLADMFRREQAAQPSAQASANGPSQQQDEVVGEPGAAPGGGSRADGGIAPFASGSTDGVGSANPAMKTPLSAPQSLRSSCSLLRVPLGELRFLEPDVQPREAVDDDTVKAYAAVMAHEGVLPPPVVYQAPAAGHYVVVDGMHRVKAAQEVGQPDIEVEVRVLNPEYAAVEAVLLNLSHGRPLSKDERKRALTTLLAFPEYQGKPNTDLAKLVALSDKTVADVRERFGNSEYDTERRYRRRDGTTRRSVARKPRRKSATSSAKPGQGTSENHANSPTTPADYAEVVQQVLHTIQGIPWEKALTTATTSNTARGHASALLAELRRIVGLLEKTLGHKVGGRSRLDGGTKPRLTPTSVSQVAA